MTKKDAMRAAVEALTEYLAMHGQEYAGKDKLRSALSLLRSALEEGEPALLFDGYYVWDEGLTEDAKRRTSPENVADVLDAVVRLMRASHTADKEPV